MSDAEAAAVREAVSAAEALGFTWAQWVAAMALRRERRYLAIARKIPCARTAGCFHVLAGIHGLN